MHPCDPGHPWLILTGGPADWLDRVNAPQPDDELARLRTSVTRGRPFGADDWVARMCRELGLEFTLPSRGRPRKQGRGDNVGLAAGY